MEDTAGTTHLSDKMDLPTQTSMTLPKFGTKKTRVWVSDLLPHMPRTPMHCILPLPKLKSKPLLNVFRRVKPLSSHTTRSMSLATFVERKDIGPMNVARFEMKPCADTAKTNGHSLGPSRHPGHGKDTTKKDEENSKQTSKVGKHSSHGHKVNQDCKWTYLSLVLQVHTAPVVYFPFNGDAH